MNKEIKINIENKIVMAFTDPVDGDENPYKYFTDDFTGEGVHKLLVFDTPEEFIRKWLDISDQPNGMWYWVLDNGEVILSGAVDPCDIECFEEYWDIDILTKYEMEQKVKEYITSDIHKLEDYSDIEICTSDDYEDALKIMDEKVKSATLEALESFCDAIDRNAVDYMTHGCR